MSGSFRRRLAQRLSTSLQLLTLGCQLRKQASAHTSLKNPGKPTGTGLEDTSSVPENACHLPIVLLCGWTYLMLGSACSESLHQGKW